MDFYQGSYIFFNLRSINISLLYIFTGNQNMFSVSEYQKQYRYCFFKSVIEMCCYWKRNVSQLKQDLF